MSCFLRYDHRLNYSNLKEDLHKNLVGFDELQRLWLPKLEFSWLDGIGYTLVDEDSDLVIIRNGNFSNNPLTEA